VNSTGTINIAGVRAISKQNEEVGGAGKMKAFARSVQESKHPLGEAVLCSTRAGGSMGKPDRSEGMCISVVGWSPSSQCLPALEAGTL